VVFGWILRIFDEIRCVLDAFLWRSGGGWWDICFDLEGFQGLDLEVPFGFKVGKRKAFKVLQNWFSCGFLLYVVFFLLRKRVAFRDIILLLKIQLAGAHGPLYYCTTTIS
jgi:hypothetical protein